MGLTESIFYEVNLNTRKLISLILNLLIFFSENISSILIEAECFKGLIQLLDFSDTVNYSLAIMSLYNRLLDSEEEDFNQLKVSTNDLITYMEKFISYFFKLCLTINGKTAIYSFINLFNVNNWD